ncbi:conjugal transfer protein TraB, partial [Moraxella catarrhalis]|nr:conjugal transfer protein TraB [Moraxella catarrhalis]
SGVVSATGSVASSIGSTQTSIGGLSTSTVRGSDAARAAIGGGISEGSNTLAEYYREQAERLFDVIEVDAGRAPEVLITSPIEFPAGIKLRK